MGKPIILTDEQIDELQESGRIVVDGQTVRTEVTSKPRKTFSTVAEAISKGDEVETFATETAFCVEDYEGNNQDIKWYCGVNMGGLWIVARMRPDTVDLERRNPNHDVLRDGFQNIPTEDVARATFYEGELDHTPANSDEFVDYLNEWTSSRTLGDDGPEKLETGVYGKMHHDFERVLDKVFEYYGCDP